MPNRPNPSGWKGGAEDFTFLTATHGRLSEDHYGTEDGYKDRRNDKKHFDWGDSSGSPERGENVCSDPWEDM